jgi:hypothetical protein
MFCSICQNPQQAEMIIDYAYSRSLRATASRFNAGYRSFLRHLEHCIVTLTAEKEQKGFQRDFEEAAKMMRIYFQPEPEPYRRKSIITKKVEFTWSRRAWAVGRNNGKKGVIFKSQGD